MIRYRFFLFLLTSFYFIYLKDVVGSRNYALHQELTQLKNEFERLQQEIIGKFEECTVFFESAKTFNQEAITMMKNVENSLVNVSNETKEWQEIQVELDVGGDRYTTSVETLTCEKDTFLKALFSCQWKIEFDQ